MELKLIFDGWTNRILSISYMENLQILIIDHEDGAYLVYNLEKNDPCGILTTIPQEAMTIWTSSPKVQFSGSYLPYQLTFRNASLFFIILDITTIKKEEWNLFLNKVLDDNDDTYGYLILGRDLVPTLFYLPFRLKNQKMTSASSFVGGIHYVQRQYLKRVLDSQVSLDDGLIVDFLPVLTQLMLFPNDIVDEICVQCIMKLLSKITFTDCQRLGRPYIISNGVSDITRAEQFLISVLSATHPNGILSDYYDPLCAFLIKESESLAIQGTLALALLLHGFTFWSKHTRVDIYQKIMKGILHEKHNWFLDESFG